MNSIHYQIRRILAWLYPDFSRDMVLQQLNSVMAIGSGQLYGKGLFNESLQSVKNGQFLMEEDTDFIFAVVGEELGFAGSCILIALFTLLVLECLWLATRAEICPAGSSAWEWHLLLPSGFRQYWGGDHAASQYGTPPSFYQFRLKFPVKRIYRPGICDERWPAEKKRDHLMGPEPPACR